MFKYASNRYIDIQERETWSVRQKRAAKQSHAREDGIGLFFAVKIWILARDASSVSYLLQRFDQKKVTALAHHKPQVCAGDDHLPHHEHSICAVGDHVLPESKKEQVKTPEPTQQEFVVKASQEAGFSKTVDIGQCFRKRVVCYARGRSIAPYFKEFTKPRCIEGSRMIRTTSWTNQSWSRSSCLRLRGSRSLVR